MINYKKLYFLGAGSTKFLSMPTTEDQNKFIQNRLETSGNPLFKDLHDFYLDFYSNRTFTLNSILSLIDSQILDNKDLQSVNDKNRIYPVDLLRHFRKLIKGIILDEFNITIKREVKTDRYKKLIGFYKRLAAAGLERKKQMLKSCDILSPDFINHDYAIINLNWDLWSVMPMLIAHKELNHDGNNKIVIDEKERELRIYSDFSYFMPCTRIIDKKSSVWYPYNEAVCTRINDKKNQTNKLATIVKTFLPHGIMNLYRCPSCGKYTYKIGKRISMDDEELYVNNQFTDEVLFNCPNCGNPIKALDTEILMQTYYKVKSSYITEVQNDMKVVISHADEIVFIGYSLPIDDLDYRVIFTSLVSDKVKIKVILFDDNYKEDNGFHPIEYYKDLSAKNKSNSRHFTEVFGDRVLFSFGGASDCFDNEEIYR